MKNKKGYIAAIAIIIFIAVITAGTIGWLFVKKTQEPPVRTVITQPIAPIAEKQLVDKNIGKQLYRNDKHGFSLDIPKDWAVEEAYGNYTSTIRLYGADFTANKQFEVPNIRIDVVEEDPEAVQMSLEDRGEITIINGIEMHRAYSGSNFEILFRGKESDILYYIYFCAGKEKPEYYKNILEQISLSFKLL